MNSPPINPDRGPLVLVTGFDDDLRQPLLPGHPLYRMAAWLESEQDRWPRSRRETAFLALVDSWPRQPGRSPRAESQYSWAVALRASGYSRAEIAEVLGVTEDTLGHSGAWARAQEPGGWLWQDGDSRSLYSRDDESGVMRPARFPRVEARHDPVTARQFVAEILGETGGSAGEIYVELPSGIGPSGPVGDRARLDRLGFARVAGERR